MAAIGAASIPVRTRPSRKRAGLRAVPAPPELPDGIVSRPKLVERLLAARETDLVLVVAPAGYGKTTLLREWALTDSRPVAWYRLTADDDEPGSLAGTIAELRASIPRDADFAIVLDDVHVLRRRASLDQLVRLIDDLGERGQLVLAGRTAPALPVARLRTERRLLELRSADLVLNRPETAAIAAANGLELEDGGRDLLARRTEGWAAGVYLAALAVRDAPEALPAFGGDDTLVGEYLRDEMLAGLPRKLTDFLRRASVLGRLSAPACDYVLERHDSGRLLADLARSNVLLVALDRTGSEYRLHRLLADTLRSDLRRSHPDAELALHARACTWYSEHGDPESAMDHALAAGDVDRAADVLWQQVPALLAYGHGDALATRLARFSAEQIQASAPLGIAAAAARLVAGDRPQAEHYIATTESSSSFRLDAFHSALAPRDLALMREDAASAGAVARDDSPWKSLACLVEGVALYLAGETGQARARLDEGTRRGAAVAPLVQALCLAELALIALDEDDHQCAATFVNRARTQTERVMLGDYPTTALVFAVSAAVNGQIGHVEACERDCRRAEHLLGQLTDFSPWYTAQCRIALANASLWMSDHARACRLLAEAQHDLALLPGDTAAHRALARCMDRCETVAAARKAGDEALTAAELRVLQFLPTHLSFPEIADQLYVSRNTVKTHVRAVYRKLAASGRSDAVARARDAGLLAPAV